MKYIFLIIVYVLSNTIMFKIGFRYGVRQEQRARLRRINTLAKLLNGNL